MVYLPNIPQATDATSVSAGQIQGNFSQANTSFGVDHYAFDDSTGNTGKHKSCQFVRQAAKPLLAGTDIGVYAKLGSESLTQLFFESSAGVEAQISGKLTDAAIGETALFGGLGIKWGTFAFVGAATSIAITFAGLGLGDYTTTYAVIPMGNQATTNACTFFVSAVTGAGFTVNRLGDLAVGLTGSFIVIGKV